MDKNKLIELLKDAWNDGNSQYHDCKYSHEYKQDLENWLDSNEDEINELCEGKNAEASESNCTIHGVSNSVCSDCVHQGTSKWLDPCHTCREGDLKQTDC